MISANRLLVARLSTGRTWCLCWTWRHVGENAQHFEDIDVRFGIPSRIRLLSQARSLGTRERRGLASKLLQWNVPMVGCTRDSCDAGEMG